MPKDMLEIHSRGRASDCSGHHSRAGGHKEKEPLPSNRTNGQEREGVYTDALLHKFKRTVI